MSVTSVRFVFAFILSVLFYSAVPRRIRYLLLFSFSAAFLYLSSPKGALPFALLDAGLVWLFAVLIEKDPKRAGAWCALGIAADLGFLAAARFSVLPAPSGISFYSVAAAGYLLDCRWGISDPEKNPLKTALLMLYWPLLTSGPIIRRTEVREELLEGKTERLTLERLSSGAQRMLWGFFKKLVIAERAALFVNAVYADPSRYSGWYIWAAAGIFMLQLYTDFSGCMDIILGASQIYGVALPENFRTPFFSVSVQEYWQRWHITLGGWLRDYVLYPLMRSRGFRAFSGSLEDCFGKKTGRKLSSYAASLVVWILIGLWHGTSLKFAAMGLWFWALITANQALQPVYSRIFEKESSAFGKNVRRILLSVKVFAFAAIGNVFFRAGRLLEALRFLRSGFVPAAVSGRILSASDVLILAASCVLLLAASLLSEKYGSAGRAVSKQPAALRWIIWLGIFAAVLVFGKYGPGITAGEFIYKGF